MFHISKRTLHIIRGAGLNKNFTLGAKLIDFNFSKPIPMSDVKKLKLLSVSIGLIFFYFGFLKFFPNASPAESLGMTTVSQLCFNLIPQKICIFMLASLEVGIGLSLISGKWLKWGIIAAIAHLVFTFSPVFLYPDQVFSGSVWTPSLLGQYIFKNLILIAALLVLYPTGQTNTSKDSRVLAA